MRVRYCGEHVQKKPDSRLCTQRTMPAVLIYVLTFHMFEHQITLTRSGDARIDQLRNVRMGEPSEDAALALEALLPRAIEADAEKLDSHTAFEPSVVAFRQPHGTHSSLAERRYQPVRADGLPAKRWLQREGDRLLEKMLAFHHSALVEQVLQLRSQFRISFAKRCQPVGPLLVRHGERMIQITADHLPRIGAETRHRILRQERRSECCDADKCALCPTSAALSARRLRASRQSQRMNIRKRTSGPRSR